MKQRHQKLIEALNRIVDDEPSRVMNEVMCKEIARNALAMDALIEKEQAEANAEVFFFGAIDRPGHYIKSKRTKIDFDDIPWREAIDGGLISPTKARHRIEAAYEQKDGWTIISFDDFMGDDRGGSNSAFFAHANLTFERLVELSKLQWPKLASRIPVKERFTFSR